MKIMTLLRGATFCIAAVAVSAHQANAADSPAGNRIADIMLHEGGTMVGVLVDSNGKPVAQEKIVLKQGNQVAAITQSNKAGQFAVRGLRGGVYQVEAGKHRSLVRAWTARTAPPAANQAVQLVTQGDIVRGQIEWEGGGVGWVEGVAVGLGTAGTVLGIIALEEAKDNNNVIPPAS